MNAHEIPGLYDRVWHIGTELSIPDVKKLAKMHKRSPLESAFLARIAQKFTCGTTPVFAKTMPNYAKEFLKCCEEERDYFDDTVLPVPNIYHVQLQIHLDQIIQFAGFRTREGRYLDQLYGLHGFAHLRQIELADQDHLTAAAISKRASQIEQRLIRAAYLTELRPPELLNLLCQRR